MSQGNGDNNHPHRETLYRPEYDDMLVEHMRLGRSFETFGAKVDVGRSTLYGWLKVEKSFSDAKERGELKSLDHFEEFGMSQLVATGNYKYFEYFMRNLHNWRSSDNTPGMQVEVEKKDDKLVLNFPKD